MTYKSYKIKLDLNNKQRSLCLGHAGVARHAYNYFVKYCKDLFEKKEKLPSAIDMHKILVAEVKKENPWYYEYSKCAPQEALRNLETAYKNFHRLQKKHNYKKVKYKTVNGKKISLGLEGLPQYKKKGVNDSFFLEGCINTNGNKIKLPRIGWVRCFENLPTEGKIKSVVVTRTANDWFVSFMLEVDIPKTIKKFDTIGVDLGIKDLATLSNGQKIKNSKPYNKAKKDLRRIQKELSRRFVRGTESQSKNYKKSKLKLSKMHQKVANARKDTIHKLTSYLSKNYETVVIEDLKVSNMVKNRNLASAILDGGFFEFKRQLLYKKEWYGGSVIIANTFYPSSKLCSCCGNKNDKLSLKDREWVCNSCGVVHDRDYNAAKNLEKLAVSSTVTAFGDESSTDDKSVQLVDELGNKHQMYTFV